LLLAVQLQRLVSQMSFPDVVDADGREIQLGGVIGKGGEGTVYGIASSGELVAKIYHNALSADRAAKIQLMSSFSNGVVKQVSAWPIGLLFSRSSRAPIGLLMPKIENAKDIHKLYSPKSRLTEFKRADWRFLVRACANTARSFGAIHNTGCIIGDINEGSVLVAVDATVRLIDCDSYQVIAQGKRYPCEVGVETFTPPELQGTNLREVVRTANHDNFGLAIMMFLLLFMGRHPFAGRFLGRGDMPIPKAISELRFAYSAMRADVQMDKPPHTPPLSIVGDDVAFLFERAFAKQMVQGGRPAPDEWVQALVKLEKGLKQCGANAAHWHRNDAACPWCPMETATGVELFPFVSLSGGVTPLDLTALWRQIESLQSPGPAPEIQIARPPPNAEAVSVASSFRRANILAFGLALMVGAIGVFGGLKAPAPFFFLTAALISFFGARRWLDKSSDVYKFRDAELKARETWQRAQQQWAERTGSRMFDEKKQEVLCLKAAVDHFPVLRTSKLDQLRNSVKQAQFSRFLDTFEIDKAKLDGIGDGRKRTLQSYGIETAADLLGAAVESVPGFGHKLCGVLYAWRDSLAARFVFDPATGIDRRDIDKIEHEMLMEQRKLEQAVRAGYGELRQLHARTLNARTQLRGPVEAACAQYLQADANYKAVSG
jgi:DNA-binding helix-hairpin-helix protein with protein kinase domain